MLSGDANARVERESEGGGEGGDGLRVRVPRWAGVRAMTFGGEWGDLTKEFLLWSLAITMLLP